MSLRDKSDVFAKKRPIKTDDTENGKEDENTADSTKRFRMELDDENIVNDSQIYASSEKKDEIKVAKKDSSDKNDRKLFIGSPHTYDDYIQSFMLLCRANNVNDGVADKFLHFTKFFMPANNKCPGDIRTVKNHYEKLLPAKNELQEINFCKNCESLMEKCKCGRSQIKAFGRLQMFSIKSQIQNIINKYKEIMTAYKDRMSQCENGIYMDSHNGKARKRILENIISLAMYTDGIKIASSSNKELWVLGFTLLDLPMKIRFSQANFVHFAMWYSEAKPPWQIFCNQITKQINDGIIIENIFYAFKILQVNADMPARAIVLNCKQCGYTPCLRCAVVGERVGNQIHFNNRENPTATISSYQELLKNSISNEQKNANDQNSVKGKSAFDQILRIPECITGDIMHSGYYGPLKNDFIEILKNKSVKKAFDEAIQRLKLPFELNNRKLRPTSEYSFYKASEWKAILFYLAAIILPDFLVEGILTGKQSDKEKHQILNFSEGIAGLECLMQDSVNETMIVHSECLLKNWFDGRKNSFGHNEYTPKTHEMMHFPDQVRIHGPLQASSCFGGENMLQNIKNMVTCKQPKIILKQIVERSSYFNEALKWRNENKNGNLKKLIQSIEKKYDENAKEVIIPETVLRQVHGDNFFDMKNKGPEMLEINGYMFAASNGKKQKDSVCYYKQQSSICVGSIEYFIEMPDGKFVAQIDSLTVKPIHNLFPESSYLRDIKTFSLYRTAEQSTSMTTVIIKTETIFKKGFFIDSEKCKYVVPILHVYEHN